MRQIAVMLVMAVVGLLVKNVVVEMGRTGIDWVFITCQELCSELHLEHLIQAHKLASHFHEFKGLICFSVKTWH